MCPSVRAQVRGGSLGGLETIKPSGCAVHGVIHLRDNKESREGRSGREKGVRVRKEQMDGKGGETSALQAVRLAKLEK